MRTKTFLHCNVPKKV